MCGFEYGMAGYIVDICSGSNADARAVVGEVLRTPAILAELAATPVVGLVARTTDPEPVDVVAPVPPFATGRVPLTCDVRPILPQDGAIPTPPEMSALPAATSLRRANVVDDEAYKISPVV